MKIYKRLSLEEREEISRLVAANFGVRAIALMLNRPPSTISRELRRFSGARTIYRSFTAEAHAKKCARSRRSGKRKIFKTPALVKEVRSKLRLFWSPEQIAQYLKLTYESTDMHVSAETIYSYIYVLPRGELRAELTRGLRRSHGNRRIKGRSAKGQSNNIADMISIEERPADVADRTVPGHWEGDLIIGGRTIQSALGTLVERTTRSVILVPITSRRAEDVRKAFAKEILKLPKQMRLSMTYDQGREMSQHRLFTKDTKMKVYFAHPRSPWERGTNENTNGLLRQFFPKGTNFKNVTRAEIKRVQKLMNERPRKTLGWKTPKEAMAELLR